MKATTATAANKLQDIPNIGPSIADDLRALGIERPSQLVGKDPYVLYRRINTLTGVVQDPCLCDCFIAAVRFMEGAPATPWWHYTAERKRRLLPGQGAKRWMASARSFLLPILASLVVQIPLAGAQQVSDDDFAPRHAVGAGNGDPPVLLFDQGHHNIHQIEGKGDALRRNTYQPFGRLAEAEGYRIRIGRGRLTTAALRGVRLLVIVNPAAVPDIKETTPAQMNAPAYSPAEVAAVRDFVSGGGSLFLVADHYPFGGAATPISASFGVLMGNGFADDPALDDDATQALIFAGPSLGDHPIIQGGNVGERVRRVGTFTGQSLTVPAGASALLVFGKDAYEEDAITKRRRPVAGRAQLVAMAFGRGRVVVAGEAAMFTSQLAGKERVRWGGLHEPRLDDEQLARNILNWLRGGL